MLTKPKPLLVVTDAATNVIISGKQSVIYVTNINRIFPAIHELQPCSIILDYDYIGNEIEKILRRIIANPFYKKIRICCYKSRSHTKVDDLFRTLGVQHFIYGEDEQSKMHANIKMLNNMLQGASLNKLVETIYA